MKKSFLFLLVFTLLLISCGTGNENKIDYSNVSTTGNPSAETSDVEETAKPCFYEVDSLSFCVLELPYHSNENLPNDFVHAMLCNPLLTDYNEALSKWDGGTSGFEEICQQYKSFIDDEIDATLKAICDRVGKENSDCFLNYAVVKRNCTNNQCQITKALFADPNSAAFLGTIIDVQTLGESLKNDFETMFRLKYWLYLLEIKEGSPDASLNFVFGNRKDQEAKDILVKTASDGFAIHNFLAPSYIDGTGADFVETMKNNPVDQFGTPSIPLFEKQISYAKQTLEEICDPGSILQSYCSSAKEVGICEKECLNILSRILGEEVISPKNIENSELDSYRQLLFDLKYWSYVMETETQAGTIDLSLKFAE